VQVAFHVHLAGIFLRALDRDRCSPVSAPRPWPEAGARRNRRLPLGWGGASRSPEPACNGKVRLRNPKGTRFNRRGQCPSNVLGSPRSRAATLPAEEYCLLRGNPQGKREMRGRLTLGSAGAERTSALTRVRGPDTSNPHSSYGTVPVRDVSALPVKPWPPVSISRQTRHIDLLTERAARRVPHAAPCSLFRGVAPPVPDKGTLARRTIVRCPCRTIAAGIAWFRCAHPQIPPSAGCSFDSWQIPAVFR
jgi:hypothetical protein